MIWLQQTADAQKKDADVTTDVDVTTIVPMGGVLSETITAAAFCGSSFSSHYAATTTGGAATAAVTETAAGSLLFCCFCAATVSATTADAADFPLKEAEDSSSAPFSANLPCSIS